MPRLVMAANVLLLMFMSLASSFAYGQFQFAYQDFNGVSENDLYVSGHATINNNQGELLLTGNELSSYGRIMKNQPIDFCSKPTSFSTNFTFSIEKKDPAQVNADGLAFLIAPNRSAPSNNSYGRWLALFEPSDNGSPNNHLVAVEFDTFKNFPSNGYPEFQDISDNHVGINLNSIISINASNIDTPRFGNGNIAVRIEYDAFFQVLKVYISSDTSFTRLSTPALEHSVNLCAYLQKESYVGFSAGSGAGNVDFHKILSWNFSSELSNIRTRVPSSEPKTKESSRTNFKVPFIISVTCTAVAVLVLLCLAGYMYFHPRKRLHSSGGYLKQNNLVLLPHEMRHGDIIQATQNFNEKMLLGRGGFGSVYKGVLPEDQSIVAVKRISKESGQGEREFLSEVKIISNLSHRNLVKLRGWCKWKRELILVYEYMPQGSLDQALFGNKAVLLLWETRFNIITGLAAALVYLHEEWERQVVHRDIKCSNVMLDAEFNARLGDFGLARVGQHGVSRSTVTTVAGTVGYIAPEVGYTFQFTPASDTYSFGVVVLETVCGKKAVSPEGGLLLPWVEECVGQDALLSVVDPRLHGIYDPDEVLRVLKTALMCIDEDPSKRPSMRQVLNLLFTGEMSMSSSL